MAVSTNYQPLVFSGNGSTTAFSITWQFFDSDDLTVIAIDGDGVETVQTITTHYTVSGGTDANGLPATGTVTMVTAPASGTTLRVERNTDRLQSTTWTNSGPFQAKSVEAGLDRVTLIAQESSGGNSGLTPKIDGDMLALETSGATDYYDGGAYPIRSSHTASDDDDLINKAYADANLGGAAAETAVSAAASATASATAASNAQTAAEAALDSFDDRYLGAKASDPVLDNDGDALAAGMLYFDTTLDGMKVYDGAAWELVAPDSSDIVTLTDAQTLTNKTIDSASNTLTIDLSEATVTGTKSEFNTAVSDDTVVFASDLIDEDDMSSDSDTRAPTQQSVKAYVDNEIVSAGAVSANSTTTFTNKTIDSASNTLTVDLSEATVTGTTAEFNAALSDGSFATLAGTETLTNKTLTSPDIDLGSDAEGDIYYRNGSGNLVRLPIGSATQLLTVNSGATAPEWSDPDQGLSPWARKTGAYTAVSGDRLLADTGGGAFTITLPASPSGGDEIEIVLCNDPSTNNLTVGRNSETIEGDAADMTVSTKTNFRMIYDGTDSDWKVTT
jgi:hypothetical protein